MRELWVAHADVAGHAFGEVFAREHAEGAGHVGEEPGAVGGEGGEGGDGWEGRALGYGLEGGLGFGGIVFGFGYGLFGFYVWDDIVRDCGGCHCAEDLWEVCRCAWWNGWLE